MMDSETSHPSSAGSWESEAPIAPAPSQVAPGPLTVCQARRGAAKSDELRIELRKGQHQMARYRLIVCVAATALMAAPAFAGDTLYVDLSGIDTVVANPPLTAQQKADLKAWILADIQANFTVAGVDITVTDNASASADRTVHIKPDTGTHQRSDNSTGYHYGEWEHGSKESNVHLGNFFSRHGDDYKTNGQWDLDKLRKGIGRTAAHEVAHSYSVGHNSSDPPNKMTEGGLVGSSTRANTEWIFDNHTGEVMNKNLGKKPCQTTADYDDDMLVPYFWESPLFPNPEWDPNDPNSDPFNDLDEYGYFDALLLIEGPLSPMFDLGWYGADSDGGLTDGSAQFDFVYKASMAEPEPTDRLTFFEVAHATAQFVLEGRVGSGYDGQWFLMSEATVALSDPVITPAGDEVFRLATLAWDVDGDFIDDVIVTLNSYMLYPFGADLNGWRLEHIPPCRGDLDLDGDRDLADLARLLSHYGTSSGALYPDGDLDGDRDVDLADLAGLLSVYGVPCPEAPYCVPPGEDCWRTPCGGSFADFAANPIQADFFGPGSDPFEGQVSFGGVTGLMDTRIQRLGEMCLEPNVPADVPIELVDLNLLSCQPVTVTIQGVPTFWDVNMTILGPQPLGVMSATKTHPNGGVFTAEFSFQPVYIFTRAEPPFDTHIWDTAAQGIPTVLMQNVGGAPWSTDELYDLCTADGFAAGVAEGLGGEPCAAEVCFSSAGTTSNTQCMRASGYPDCP